MNQFIERIKYFLNSTEAAGYTKVQREGTVSAISIPLLWEIPFCIYFFRMDLSPLSWIFLTYIFSRIYFYWYISKKNYIHAMGMYQITYVLIYGVATFYIGWSAGFLFHLFPVMIVAAMGYRGHPLLKKIIAILAASILFFSACLIEGQTPIFDLPDMHIKVFLLVNVFFSSFPFATIAIDLIGKADAVEIQLEITSKENERLLHNILPKTIAEQLKNNNEQVVQRFEDTSILFADLVGFTTLSEKLSPQEVVDLLNGLFSEFDDLTDKYGIEKIKTIGDAYMVAAGVPEENNDHARVLFLFAKEMLEVLTHYNQSQSFSLKLRIGISSGPVVAGVIGKKKFAYDLWGDTVNTAARMEAYGHEDRIQISQTTYEILKSDFDFEKISDVEIKGKGKMDVYLWKNEELSV